MVKTIRRLESGGWRRARASWKRVTCHLLTGVRYARLTALRRWILACSAPMARRWHVTRLWIYSTGSSGWRRRSGEYFRALRSGHGGAPASDIPRARSAFKSTIQLVTAAVIVLAALCGAPSAGEGKSELSGKVRIDGSSTVFPISEAVAEEFQIANRKVRVTVGISGTGGGFKKFCPGETDLNDASRPIKEKEIEIAKKNGIEFIELPVAFDGISVLVNPANDFVDYLTVDELRKIWQPGSTVNKWSDVRPGWPDEPIHLYGPGTDSGTFDYFTKAINGREQASRPDFTASEDDNVLVQGIAGDRNALGFFGYAYYAENKDKLKAVPIDGGAGPVAPSVKTINNGTYKPLSRPIFIYVSVAAAKRREVQAFVKFYLANAPVLVGEVGYVPLPAKIYKLDIERFEKRITGSAFRGKKTIGLSLEDVLNAES